MFTTKGAVRRSGFFLMAWVACAALGIKASNLDFPHTVVPRDAVNVTAVCGSEYAWMNNGKGQSPCVVAAWVEAACSQGGSWSVSPISGGNRYDPPSGALINACTCSWATYNLLSACTVCQNSVQVQTWGTWKMNCGQLLSGQTYFPSDKGFTLPDETAIPYWAGYNPASWPNAQFDTSQAQSLSQQGRPDLTGAPVTSASPSSTPAPTKSSSDLGAIVGGVIGGLAVVLVALTLIACRVIRRRRRQHAQQQQQTQYSQQGPPLSTGPQGYSGSPRPDLQHMRSMSDSSTAYLDPSRYTEATSLQLPIAQPTPLVSNPAVLPISPHMQLVSASGRVKSYPATMQMPSSYVGPRSPMSPTVESSQSHLPSSSVHSLGSGSAAQTGSGAAHGGGLEDMIPSYPHSGNDPSNQPSIGSKGKAAAFFSHGPNVPPPSQRARMNPPVYTSEPSSGEVQTMAPTAPEDRTKKHVFMTAVNPGSPTAMVSESDKGQDVASHAVTRQLEVLAPPPALEDGQRAHDVEPEI